MNEILQEMSYVIELQPGEEPTFPAALADSIGPGKWVITVRPSNNPTLIRDHSAFLSGYAPEDEGLYAT